MSEIKFEIKQHIAEISQRGDWTFELNRVSFNDKPEKWDIRSWNEDHTKMSKGITLTDDEFNSLKDILSTL